MPFPSAYTNGQITRIRGGTYDMTQQVIIDVPTVILQFNPSAANISNSVGSIPFSSTLSGSFSNVKAGMLVLVTPSSSYAADLKNKPEQCLVTYARKAALSNTLYIGGTSYAWGTGDYVTVLSTFTAQAKRYRLDNSGTQTKDYDLSYRKPLPRIVNVQSAYVDVTASGNAVFNISATATDEDTNSTTMASWSWSAIRGNASISNSTTASPTITIANGLMDWVYGVATTTGGVSNWIATFVANVPTSGNAPVDIDLIASQVTMEIGQGNSAAIAAELDMSQYLDRMRVVVFSTVNYTDGQDELPVTNIDFVGELVGDSVTTQADEREGVKQSVQFKCEGWGQVANRLDFQGIEITRGGVPAWDYLNAVSIRKALWHIGSEHSTLFNLCALDFEGQLNNFATTHVTVNEGSLFNALDQIAALATANHNHAASGEWVVARDLNYEEDDADRNSATVIITFDTRDGELVAVDRNYLDTYNQVRLAAFVYDSADNIMKGVVDVLAPSTPNEGGSKDEVGNHILEADLSIGDAIIKAGKRAANHWRALNPAPTVTIRLLGGYKFSPTCNQWYKLDFPAAENARGLVYDTNTRLMMYKFMIEHDTQRGTRVNVAELREETQSDSYRVFPSFVAIGAEGGYPATAFRPTLPLVELSGLNPQTWNRGNTGAGLIDTETPVDLGTPLGAQDVRVPFSGELITTPFTLDSGASYRIEVNGRCIDYSGGWCNLQEFALANGGWQAIGANTGDYVSNFYWRAGNTSTAQSGYDWFYSFPMTSAPTWFYYTGTLPSGETGAGIFTAGGFGNQDYIAGGDLARGGVGEFSFPFLADIGLLRMSYKVEVDRPTGTEPNASLVDDTDGTDNPRVDGFIPPTTNTITLYNSGTREADIIRVRTVGGRAGSLDSLVTDVTLAGFNSDPFSGGNLLQLVRDLGADYTLTNIAIDWEFTNARVSETRNIYFLNSSDVVVATLFTTEGDASGRRVNTWSGSVASVRKIQIYADNNPYEPTQFSYVHNIQVSGTPAPNPFGVNNCSGASAEYKDSFYKWEAPNGAATAFGTGEGLQVDGADVATIPDFDATGNGRYEFPYTGTGAAATFQWVDDDADYTGNSLSDIQVRVWET